MHKISVESFIIIVLVLIVAGFALAFSEIPSSQEYAAAPADENGEVQGTTIDLTHSYYADANTYSGTLQTPTPCHVLVPEVEILGTTPEQIKLKLDTQQQGDACAQVVADKDFTIVIPSSREAQLVALELNGQSVPFELDSD